MSGDIGINPDLDYLFDPQQKGEPPIYCNCCRRPVTESTTYTEIGRFFFCGNCMVESVEHLNLMYG